MDIPLPEDPPVEESSLHDIPIPDDANRYSPSLPIEDDPPELKETSEISLPAQPTTSVGQNISVPILLGKSAAKKRLLAFSLAKQSLPNVKKLKSDKSFEDIAAKNVPKENDQVNMKKKRKKGVLDKARDTISEIEEIKRKENVVRESMQVLYPRWVNRDGAGTGTTHLSLPDIEEDDSYKIENLVEKLLAKKAKRERSEKEKEAEKRERRERREKEKVVPKSWDEFNKAGFIAYHYRRLKYRREKLPRASKSRHSRSRSEGDEGDSIRKKYNLLDTPMILKVPLTVIGVNDEYKDFPSWAVKYTDTRPKLSYSVNPIQDNSMLISRKEMLKTLADDIFEIVNKFWEMKPLLRIKDEPVDDRSWWATEEFMVPRLQEVDETLTCSEIDENLNYDNIIVKHEPRDYSEEYESNNEEEIENIKNQGQQEEGQISESDTGLKEEQVAEEEKEENQKQEGEETVEEQEELEESELQVPNQDQELELEPGVNSHTQEIIDEQQITLTTTEQIEEEENLIESANEGMLASEYEQFMKTIEDQQHCEKSTDNCKEDYAQSNGLPIVEGEDEWSRTTSVDRNSENISYNVEKLRKSSMSLDKNRRSKNNTVTTKKKKMHIKRRKRKRSLSTSSDSSSTSTSSSSSSSSSTSSSSSSSSSSPSSSSSSSTSSSTSSSSSNDSSSDSSSSSSSSYDSKSSSDSPSAFKKKKLKQKLKKKELLIKKRKQKQKAAKKARLTKKKTKKLKNVLDKKRNKLSPLPKSKRERNKEDIKDIREEKRINKNCEQFLNETNELYFSKLHTPQEGIEYNILSSSKKRVLTDIQESVDSTCGLGLTSFNKGNRYSKSDLSSAENSHLSSDGKQKHTAKRHFNLDIFQDEKSSNSNNDYYPIVHSRLIDYDFSSDDSQVEKPVVNSREKESTNLAQVNDESFEKSPEIYSPTAADEYEEEEEDEEGNKIKANENVSTVDSSHIDDSSQLVSFGVNSASQEARMLDIPLPPPKQATETPPAAQTNLTTSFHNILQQSPSSASFSPQRKNEEKGESPICIGKSGARLTFGKQMTKLKPLNIFSGEDSDSEMPADKPPLNLEKFTSPTRNDANISKETSDSPKTEEQSVKSKSEIVSSDDIQKQDLEISKNVEESGKETANISFQEKKSRWDISELPSSNENKATKQARDVSITDLKNVEDKNIVLGAEQVSHSHDKTSDKANRSGRDRSRSRSSEKRHWPLTVDDHSSYRSRERRSSRERRNSREKRRESRKRDRSRERRRRHSNERRRSSERSSQYKFRQVSPHRRVSPFSAKLRLQESCSKLSPPTSRPDSSYFYMKDKCRSEGYNIESAYHGSDDYNSLDNETGNSAVVGLDSQDKNYITIKTTESASYESPVQRPSQCQRSSVTRESHSKRHRSPSYKDSPSHRSPDYEKDIYYRSKSSPSRRRSPSDRRGSPDYSRGSPPRRRLSPDRKSNYSPYRWESPMRRNPSPGKSRRSRSPLFRRYSPDRKRDTLIEHEDYPENSSYNRRSLSPQKRLSPPHLSEEGRRLSGPSRQLKNSPASQRSPNSTPSHDTSSDWKWNYQSNLQNDNNFNSSLTNSTQRNEYTSQNNKKLVGYTQHSDINDYQMSLADSTISDSELVKDVSPKRLSLDERLQIELGETDVSLTKDTTASYSNYYYQPEVSEPHNYYHSHQYLKPNTSSNLIHPPTVEWNVAKSHPTTKVVQVGNVLQVVPTEITTMSSSYPSKPNTNASVNKSPKIVQVGNVLQVVPRTEIAISEELDIPKPQQETVNEVQQNITQVQSQPPPPPPPPLPPPQQQQQQQLQPQSQPQPQQQQQQQQQITHFLPVPPPSVSTTFTPAQIVAAPPPPPPSHSNISPVSSVFTSAATMQVENVLTPSSQIIPPKAIPAVAALVAAQPVGSPSRLLKLEEKERRRKEKELRRRKKEQKAARRAAAALRNEEENNSVTESVKSCNTPHPAPVPILPNPDKGILVSSGFRDSSITGSESKKVKSVSFADGIKPGYGSSPSGGEEHPLSPPPIVRKTSKKKKRRKVKVRIVRIEGNTSKNEDEEDEDEEEEDEEEDEDDLSPPPPPPGTPPPEAYYDYTAAGGYLYPQPFTVPTRGNDDKIQPQVLTIKGMTPTPVINYGAPPPPPPPVNATALR